MLVVAGGLTRHSECDVGVVASTAGAESPHPWCSVRHELGKGRWRLLGGRVKFSVLAALLALFCCPMS